MFSLTQVSIALAQLHALHLACYHNPLTNIVAVALALIVGMLGMYMWTSCPYRQACTSKVDVRAHLVNGLPVVIVERVTYITQF